MSEHLSPDALRALADRMALPIEPFQADMLGDNILQALGAFPVEAFGQKRAYVAFPVARLYQAIRENPPEEAERLVHMVYHGGVAKVDFGRVETFIAAAQAPDQDPFSQVATDMGLRIFAGGAVLAGLVRADNLLPGSEEFRDLETGLGDRGVYDSNDGGVDREVISQIGAVLLK